MSLTAKPSKGSPPIPGGTYQAVCYAVVDLGTQYNEIFKKSSPKVVITWEIPSLRIEYEKDGHPAEGPRVISKTYTNILHEKSNLYQDLINWRGRDFTAQEAEGFNVSQVLSANCILTVVNTKKKDRVYANVGGVAKLMDGMKKLIPESKIIKYDIDDGIGAIPKTVPDWIVEIIKKCAEFNEQVDPLEPDESITTGGEANPDYVGDDPAEPPEDDIPF